MDYRLGGDALYGLSLRPQELDLYRSQARCELRYAPICDDDDPPAGEHHKLLVLALTCDLPPDPPAGRSQAMELELLKCGWQLQVLVDPPCPAAALPEHAAELPLLLARIWETVADLGRRAGLEDLLPEDLRQRLVADYRARHPATADDDAAHA